MYLVLEVININCKTTAFITTFENFLLPARVVNVWNSLSDHVVDELDKF